MTDVFLPWPYAAKALIQHEYDIDHLNIWLTFRFAMDQTVIPANYECTGTLNPDFTGDYEYTGVFNGKDLFRKGVTNQYCWWNPGTSSWIINNEVGIIDMPYFERVNADPIGEYQPEGGSTGVAAFSEKFTVTVDDVHKFVMTTEWEDMWTLLMTIHDVLALPDRVFVEYNGPDENLRISWQKQWEPWGPILSLDITT